MSMHDIWNPWHGCKKKSEGCANCYMYFLDKQRNMDGSVIFKTKADYAYPLHTKRDGSYVVKPGETLRVCMTSDFFLEEADEWREDAWNIIRERPDVIFFLLTKRPERVLSTLPSDWNEGWENVFFNVSCENQKRADERMPLLMELPFKHKGVMCAPFIGKISLKEYLSEGVIERVVSGGENYDGSRPCDFDWVLSLREECVESNTTFCFIETGSVFIKDGKKYNLKDKRLQAVMAHRSNTFFQGKEFAYNLSTPLGFPIEKYEKYFSPFCQECGSRPICNGCQRCRNCIFVQ